MPNLIDRVCHQRNAKRASFVSIRHSPEFGIASEIVRREFANANLGGELLNDVPDQLFRHSFAPHLAGALTRRKRLPALIPAAVVQSFKGSVTQSGTGMVRI